MMFKIASFLLIAWLLGVLGVYRVGNLVHILSVVGLMLLLLAFFNARRCRTAGHREPPDKR